MVAVAHHPTGPFSLRAVGRVPRPVCALPTEVVYRRRRLVVAILVLSVLLGGRVAADLVGSGPLAAPEPTPPVLVSERSYVVQPGDTLWTIARSLQPTGDVRRLVDRLAAQRHGAALQVGERIVLP